MVNKINSLTLNEYQREANKTAIYPRLFTEGQVRQIVGFLTTDIEELRSVSSPRVLESAEVAMDVVETPFNRLVYPALGLAGEAGELANKVKKFARDNDGVVTPDDQVKLADELGDTLWYEAAFATGLEIDLDEIGEVNLLKLASRANRGALSGSGDTR